MLADTDMQTVIGARQSLERLADSASSWGLRNLIARPSPDSRQGPRDGQESSAGYAFW